MGEKSTPTSVFTSLLPRTLIINILLSKKITCTFKKNIMQDPFLERILRTGLVWDTQLSSLTFRSSFTIFEAKSQQLNLVRLCRLLIIDFIRNSYIWDLLLNWNTYSLIIRRVRLGVPNGYRATLLLTDKRILYY